MEGIQHELSHREKRKWHIIFSSIALLSIYKKSATKLHGFFQIDRASLFQCMKEKDIHQLTKLGGVIGVASALRTDADNGISIIDGNEVAKRREYFGTNTYRKPPRKGFLYHVKKGFQDLAIIILMVCAALSLVLGVLNDGLPDGLIDGVSMLISIFIIISVTTICNYKRQKQFESILKVTNIIRIDVVRDGSRQNILTSEILVGDVICIEIGDRVPADGLFIQGRSLQVDESSQTGESDHVEINHGQNPFMFSGTTVVHGNGRMIVTSVGMNTRWGQMMTIQLSSNSSDEKSPLRAQLEDLLSSIFKVGLAIDLLIIVVLIVRYFTGNIKDENGYSTFKGSKTKFIDIFKFVMEIIQIALVILVAAIPEGLPMALTLTFVHAMKRMMAKNVMVMELSVCEVMGVANIICTDKTGTLTMNQMKVAKFWLGKECMEDRADYSSMAPNLMELFQQGIALNTSGSVHKPSNEITGSPTEKAILSWAVEELNMDMEVVEKNLTSLSNEAFSSHSKRSGVLTESNVDGVTVIQVHWKGAPEVILEMCSSYYDASGFVNALDENQKVEFQKIIEGMAASSLRCIAFAHAKQDDVHEDLNGQLKKDGLVLLGMVGIKDPCRPGVNKAVTDCRSAKVNVKMITGDNIFTAKAIATECGILRPDQGNSNEAVIEGAEFRKYSSEERMEKVDQICVMARSSPADKLLMVQCLKDKGHVVAVTGDGTNDASALKEADIGLSMGDQGTEEAKESSNIILLDDDFKSVVTVLKWGRCVYNNIEKFVQFQLTANIAAMVINLVATVSGREIPLTTLELLWVNLIMDTLGALALASDKPTKERMEKPPVVRTEPIVTNIMWRNLLPQALYQIAVVLTLLLKGELLMFGVEGPDDIDMVKDTLAFNTFVLCHVFNLVNARKLEEKNVFKGILGNKLFIVIVATIIVVQVVMVEILNGVAGTERLSLAQWSVCIGIGAMSWPIGWVVKCIPVPERKNWFTRAMDAALEVVDHIKIN